MFARELPDESPGLTTNCPSTYVALPFEHGRRLVPVGVFGKNKTLELVERPKGSALNCQASL